MTDMPFMPVDVMVENIAEEGCDIYVGGDNPGWFNMGWNPDSRELALRYQPDTDPESDFEYGLTEHVFRLGAQARVGGPDLGEVAYSGYFAACDGRSLTAGGELPPWDEQSDYIRAAWTAAAEAVRKAV